MDVDMKDGEAPQAETEDEIVDRLLKSLETIPKGSNKQIILKLAKKENLPPRVVARALMPKRYLSRKVKEDDSDNEEKVVPMEQDCEGDVLAQSGGQDEVQNGAPNPPYTF
ncbi:uncharacterized protein LOC119671741 [Teleopsis dalmanni]|uniref:uncharacterized protein LOC119671741 n=1 Tax=Teleopsis dalmanni TaxID=139649 RepID=UPI0018CFACBA|nr:uncharacterized protein LOC119671741 [Teleopsis dalmanni]